MPGQTPPEQNKFSWLQRIRALPDQTKRIIILWGAGGLSVIVVGLWLLNIQSIFSTQETLSPEQAARFEAVKQNLQQLPSLIEQGKTDLEQAKDEAKNLLENFITEEQGTSPPLILEEPTDADNASDQPTDLPNNPTTPPTTTSILQQSTSSQPIIEDI